MKLLDLFCGEGGAAAGYHQAGFEIHGVDHDHHRLDYYPYPCTQADALDYALAYGHRYDLIHASPPCTGYTRGTIAIKDREERYDRLIAATRAVLDSIEVPYLIENVEGAKTEMHNQILLCGRMFGLHTHDTDGLLLVLDRHRLFEPSHHLRRIRAPHHPEHHRSKITVAGAYSGARTDRAEAKHQRGGGYTPHPAVARRLLEVPWMSNRGLELAIPPAYTHYLGKKARTLLGFSH